MIRKRQNNIFRSKKTFKGISENEKIELAICKTIALCENELKELTDDTENVTLQDILSNHIRKIEIKTINFMANQIMLKHIMSI